MKQMRALKGVAAIFAVLIVGTVGLLTNPHLSNTFQAFLSPNQSKIVGPKGGALDTLNSLDVKGRAPKTGYSRQQFGDGWDSSRGCDTRNSILKRDLTDIFLDTHCRVLSGILHDPYTNKTIQFKRGETTSSDVQIDHVVALGDAWQSGAQSLDSKTRETLANDPLELLAVDGSANQQKSDSDAASWLPPNKSYRCAYVARQIAVKKKYKLWVKLAEKSAIISVLGSCPEQKLPQ